MRLLITDLDNTLYDWVTFFAKAFRAMVKDLATLLYVDEGRLLDEFKVVHQRYGNSEQPFAILELPSVHERFPNLSRKELREVLDSPLEVFNALRNEYLHLYPSVRGTLQTLTKKGVTIVGHTEAIAVNAYYRLRKLGVIDLFHHIYAIEGRLEPHPNPERNGFHQPPQGLINFVSAYERKPNPKLLIDIL